MRVFRGWKDDQQPARASVVTIGNFDGVHLGHQALIDATCQRARDLSVASVLMTFDPLPIEFFRPGQCPARLTDVHQKLRRLQRSGLDACWMIRFDAELSNLSPEAFVERLLVQQLGAREVIIGDDFRFGKHRAGDFRLLSRLGELHGYRVTAVDSVLNQQTTRISSTLIREKLAAGEIAAANAALGWNYSMSGRVQHGGKLGRKLGYPTANIGVKCSLVALDGVFAVKARADGIDGLLPGVASLGHRPTVEAAGSKWLEVHLFDWSGNLYGRRMTVEFVDKLRDIEKYDSLDLLIEQMKRDEEAARKVLKK